MRSKQLNLERYPTDKHDFKVLNQFMEEYDRVLEPWVNKKIILLELGIHRGGSLLLWRDYFPMGTIVGIDITLPKGFPQEEHIHLFEGSQTDTKFLSEVATKMAPDGFDIIIDDASHIGEFTKQSFWHLFDNHLKPGGLYVIEDWITGYFGFWPDGKNIKIKEGFLSKLRSGLQPHINFLIKIYLIIERRILSGKQSGPMYFFNLLIKIFFLILSKILDKIKPAALRTGLLPPYNLFLKVPFESHCYGMVGFVKQLIDEQGAGDLTRDKPSIKSKFLKMIITQKMVFIHKAIEQP